MDMAMAKSRAMTRHLRQPQALKGDESKRNLPFFFYQPSERQRANEDISFEMWGLERRF